MIFGKKAKKEELKVLNEKEIQERLYGSYYRCGDPKPKDSTTRAAIGSSEVTDSQTMDLFQTEQEETQNTEDRTSPLVTEREGGKADEEFSAGKETQELGADGSSTTQDSEDDVSQRARELELRFEEETRSLEDKPLDEYFPFAKRSGGFKITSLFASVWATVDKLKKQFRTLPHKHIFLVVGGVIGFLIVFNVVSNQLARRGVEVGIPLAQQASEDSLETVVPTKQDKHSVTSSAPVVIAESKEAQQVPPPAETQTALPSTAGRYTVQMCVYKNEGDAKKLVKRLTNEGYNTFYDSFVTRRGQKFYRVFVGRFDTFQEAKEALQVYRRKPGLDGFQDSFIRSTES